MFREDVKVTMATSGLYDWLLKVVRVSGDLDKDLDGTKSGHEDSKKDKDDKKQMLGKCVELNIAKVYSFLVQLSTSSLWIIMSNSRYLLSSLGKRSFGINSSSDFFYISSTLNNPSQLCG